LSAANTPVESFTPISLPQDVPHIDNVVNTCNSHIPDTHLGTLPDFTQLKNGPLNKSISFNKLGINLLSKFSEVGENSKTPQLMKQTVSQDDVINLSSSPQINTIVENHILNAFEPQHNDDFCSTDEETDSDYNPFQYPG
jgi:hypothetical protein